MMRLALSALVLVACTKARTRKGQASVKRCFEDLRAKRAKDASARGILTLRFAVDTSGAVVDASVEGFNAEVASGVRSAMPSWTFPTRTTRTRRPGSCSCSVSWSAETGERHAAERDGRRAGGAVGVGQRGRVPVRRRLRGDLGSDADDGELRCLDARRGAVRGGVVAVRAVAVDDLDMIRASRPPRTLALSAAMATTHPTGTPRTDSSMSDRPTSTSAPSRRRRRSATSSWIWRRAR